MFECVFLSSFFGITASSAQPSLTLFFSWNTQAWLLKSSPLFLVWQNYAHLRRKDTKRPLHYSSHFLSPSHCRCFKIVLLRIKDCSSDSENLLAFLMIAFDKNKFWPCLPSCRLQRQADRWRTSWKDLAKHSTVGKGRDKAGLQPSHRNYTNWFLWCGSVAQLRLKNQIKHGQLWSLILIIKSVIK